jgi:hypothetical protein
VSDKDKADALNSYFKTTFTQEDGLPVPDIGPSSFPSITNINFSVDGVKKLLKELKTAKSQGPDNIPARVLKEIADEVAGMLTFIFHQSYNSSTMPNDWSTALVTPVFKKGNKSDPQNYRPISLTCLCCKMMEHIILSHLNKHLSSHNILSPIQHGFRRYFSCSTQLVSIIHDWASVLNDHNQVDVLMLDFSKTFDKLKCHIPSFCLNSSSMEYKVIPYPG